MNIFKYIFLVVVSLPTAAMSATMYTDEASYLAALSAAGYATIHEEFEDDVTWADSRSTISNPASTPQVNSQGILWTSNFATNDIATGSVGVGGSFGFHSSPHGNQDAEWRDSVCDVPDPIPEQCFLQDGFVGTSDGAGPLYGVGGWIKGTFGADVTLFLDAVEVNFGATSNINSWTFLGVIDTAGFNSFEFREIDGTGGQNELIFGDAFTIGISLVPPPPVAAVLPASRSVQVGDTATAFATIINTGSTTAIECSIAPLTSVPANFSYQTTDAANALVGTPDTPVDIAASGNQSYVFAFTPTAEIPSTDVELAFDCTNSGPAPVTVGLNTLLLSALTNPVSDIVALAATPTGDGIVSLPGGTGVNAFAVATVNVGSQDTITASADTGAATLPVTLSICESDPATGGCLASPTTSVTTTINAGATPTFSVFATGIGTVPFDPAANRIFVRFKDVANVTRGSTSVAVQTL